MPTCPPPTPPPFLETQRAAYEALKGRGPSWTLTRGKPSAEQLDPLIDCSPCRRPPGTPTGVDVRNYGGLTGIRQIREMFADLLWVEPSQVVAGGNSSLSIMHDCLVHLLLHGRRSRRGRGLPGEDHLRLPGPGYDRHFTMLASHESRW